MVKRLWELWHFLTRDERELPDLDPTVIEKSWLPGYGIVATRTNVRLLDQVIKAKAARPVNTTPRL